MADRLDDILARQAADNERKAVLEQRHQDAIAATKKRMEEVKSQWPNVRDALNSALHDVNERLSSVGRAIYFYQPIGNLEDDTLALEFGFHARKTHATLQLLRVNVPASGLLRVVMGTANSNNAKSYSLKIEEANAAKWREILIDFLDLNTPKS